MVDITGVDVLGEYRLRLTFEDGTVGDVDFAGREWRGVFEPLNDPAEFARVEVRSGGGDGYLVRRPRHGPRAALRRSTPPPSPRRSSYRLSSPSALRESRGALRTAARDSARARRSRGDVARRASFNLGRARR
ncbi:DUF2442 domain-containing protein [Gaiella occulta]|uniref:DUF2442 domain-containing protein n=1 Tax=Gaiella occulta TaxID=1002870 RepID=UPI003BEEBAC7